MRCSTLLTACCLVVGFASMALCAEKKTVQLFNHKDLSGWEYYLVDPAAKMEDVWSVADGVIVCKGKPMGYLATKKKFKDFKLVVEWRWPEGKKPSNSGVLLRITGQPAALPKCVEAQLQNGNAGDIWAFNGFHISNKSERFREANSPKLGKFMGNAKIVGNEKKPGQWNRYEITLQGDTLTLVVNGKKVNVATGLDQVAGQIGLQSEGGEIHFRTVELTPL